ncbi:MAG: hypothetical protein MUE54_07180 [Anaerolineae bacterium]|nr:hypothetical protein [Anaerolineae bacterium]
MGTNHFAAGIGRDLTGELAHITLVDHKADYAKILADGKRLITPDYTFYTQPPAWWEARLGRIYPVAVAPNLVEIRTSPTLADNPPAEGIIAQDYHVVCGDTIHLYVTWVSADVPDEDLRVFVHGLNDKGQMMAQGDQPAPVYLWRPMTTWVAGELVTDIYPVIPFEGLINVSPQLVRFGLYRVTGGKFENVVEYETAVNCEK